MHIFSRVVLDAWLKSFLMTFFVLLSILFVGNIVSEFLRDAASAEDIFQNFILELPQWMGKIVPISCLGASLFSIYRLKVTNGLISLFSLGYTRKSFALVLFCVSLAVALFQFFVSGYLHPLSRSLRKSWIDKTSHFRGYKKAGVRSRTVASGLIWYKSKNYFSHFSFYDKEQKKLNRFSLFYFNEKNYLYKVIHADSAVNFEGKYWHLLKAKVYSSMNGKTFPKIKTVDKLEIQLSEGPSDFENIESDVHELDVWELQKYVEKVGRLGIEASEFKVLFYEKISTSLICLVFAFLPFSGIFYPSSRNSTIGRNIIFLLVFTFAFWFMYSSSLSMGSSGKILPVLAAFGMPTICLAYIVIVIFKHRNLTG